MAIIDTSKIPRLRFRPRSAAVAVGSETEAVAARQNPVVTQTITRPYTTITALVTLGPGDPTTTAAQATVPAAASAAPSPSPDTVAVPGSPSSSSSSLTHAQLGAILGSILGSVFLIILIWYCASARRRDREEHRVRYILTEESETSSEATADVMMTGAGTQRRTGDPWVRRPEMTVVPPPPRFPPTPRYTPYRQTRNPQIRGVRRYP